MIGLNELYMIQTSFMLMHTNIFSYKACLYMFRKHINKDESAHLPVITYQR